MSYDPFRVPQHTLAALIAWRDMTYQGRPGDFMYRLLCKDLFNALLYADDQNFENFPHIVGWCYNNLPGASWGSEQKVKDWIDRIYITQQSRSMIEVDDNANSDKGSDQEGNEGDGLPNREGV